MIKIRTIANKRIAAAGLCAIGVAFIFTGCGNESPTGGNIQAEITPTSEAKPEEITFEPVFSAESGFYDEEFDLEISCADENAKIYYTLDGSIPDETDMLYTEALHMYNRSSDPNNLSAITGINPSGDYVPSEKVKKCNVVRAVAVLSDGTVTEVTSASYFVGIDRKSEYGDVPVISIMTESDNLFGYENGIYVMGKTYDEWLAENPSNAYAEGWQKEGNFSNKGREWEREATLEFIPADDSEGFIQNAGIRIMGAASRRASQKSFRVTAREEYGAKTFEYDLIPDNLRSDGTGEVEKYKSFILRNGGNDNEFGRIRDPYLQSLVSARSFETMQSTPVVVYIDGEYWGCYTLAEDYSDNYIKHNYGLDNKNVIVVKKGELEDGNEEDMYLYYDMYDFITGNDMSISENYEQACELLDMESFIQYVVFNMYIDNHDTLFQGNNYAMWRCVEPDSTVPEGDGKWRMMLYDTEYSTGIYDNGGGYNTNNIKTIINKGRQGSGGWRHPNDLLVALLENEDFKKGLVLTLCDMRNVDFEKTNAAIMLDAMEEVYIKLVPDTLERFGPEWVLYGNTKDYFAGRMDELKSYMNGRYDCFPYLIKAAFNLEEPVFVTIKTNDTSAGSVKINTTSLEGKANMSGKYFTEYPITLTATPVDGKTFAGWEYEGCVIEDTSAEEIEVWLTGDCTIRAVFE
ncbi:MAG: CotH kinase family protein [Lachnospiraceae bacterium]